MLPLVIYHGPTCLDGFTAAWAVHRARGPAELVPASYGDEPPPVDDRDVIIVDFSYPRAILEDLAGRARSLLVLDHHATARAALEGLPFAVFDLERSGAGLAWDHFHAERRRAGLGRPWLVDYVEDRDLWRFALPESRAVNAWLRTREPSLELWDELAASGDALRFARELGGAILAHIDQQVRNNASRAGRAQLGEWIVPIVNASPELASDVGNLLSKDAPFAVVWSQGADGRFHYSLRSSRDHAGAVDVSEVAKRFGGGGHRHAAGFASIERAHVIA